jgi:signal transduction histidine kinase
MQEKWSAGRTIIRQASHDIQGTFFGVSGICVLLKRAVADKEDTGILLDHLMDACQSYKYKLGNFLEYIRYDAGFRETITEPVDIRLLLSKVVEENRYAGIDICISDDVPENILTDEFRIAHICANLLSNAVNFSKDDGTVQIDVRLEGAEQWMIMVTDRGEGMDASVCNRVFSHSDDDRKTLKNPGGLGLLVTRYLVEDVLGGQISLDSKRHVGTKCKVLLPLNGSR